MEEILKVKLRPISPEAFRPYGEMLEVSKDPVYPSVEEGRLAIELLRLNLPKTTGIERMAIHFSYTQLWANVGGTLVLLLAPPPNKRATDQSNADDNELDYEKLAAFRLEAGQAVHLYKGTWHNAVTLGGECTILNLTRKNPGGEASTIKDIENEDFDRVRAARPYIEWVNIKKRDNRIIDIEL